MKTEALYIELATQLLLLARRRRNFPSHKLEKKKNQLLQQLKRTPGKTVEAEIRKAVADLDPGLVDTSI